MNDCKGNELRIGDDVVYIHGKNSDVHLRTGKITRFYTTQTGSNECSVESVCGTSAHIKSRRIMRLNTTESNTAQTADENNVSYHTDNFIGIKGQLYYDPATGIVYMENRTISYKIYTYVPYLGPNGLPYRYDPETKNFEMTHGQ